MAGKIKETSKRRNAAYLKFKGYMAENNIKQKELADLLNKSITSVNQNLNGTGGDFSLRDICLICITYKISSDEYFITQKVF